MRKKEHELSITDTRRVQMQFHAELQQLSTSSHKDLLQESLVAARREGLFGIIRRSVGSTLASSNAITDY
ncbi:hypothetical protein ACROYT_G037927 [Oculina patagonica]